MAKAAYCALCGSNVYVNDEGMCPQGHPADSLTNHYEVPELTPAERALHDANAPAEKRQLNRTMIIALLIMAFVVLCSVGACVAGIVALGTISDVSTQVIGGDHDEIPMDPALEVEPWADEGSSASFDPDAYFGNLTTHYFPGFSYVTYYTIGDTSAEPSKYQVLVESDATGFWMIFSLLRYEQDAPNGIGEQWLYAAEDGATWQRLPDRGDDDGASLADFAGPAASVSRVVAEQVMTDFVDAHPTKIVSDFESAGGKYVLRGFDESELEDWLGDSTSFESIWEPDPAIAGEWVETSF